MKTRISALLALSGNQRILIGQAWISLLFVDVALRFLSLPRVQRLLSGLLHVMPSPSESGQSGEIELARLVDIASRHHLRPMRCLQRAVVLQGFLVRRGRETELRIGVRKQQGRMHAHAWLETAGTPLAESPEIAALFLPLAPAREVA